MGSSLLICLYGFIGLVVAQRPTVTLNDGVYVGTTLAVPSATVAVDAFYGIPYAASNPERFGAPLLRPKGTETYEATKQPPVCIQQQCEQMVLFQYFQRTELMTFHHSATSWSRTARKRGLPLPTRFHAANQVAEQNRWWQNSHGLLSRRRARDGRNSQL